MCSLFQKHTMDMHIYTDTCTLLSGTVSFSFRGAAKTLFFVPCFVRCIDKGSHKQIRTKWLPTSGNLTGDEGTLLPSKLSPLKTKQSKPNAQKHRLNQPSSQVGKRIRHGILCERRLTVSLNPKTLHSQPQSQQTVPRSGKALGSEIFPKVNAVGRKLH